MNKIRTRYAPSPTGFFHVGGARTALFNYLYAKHYNGDFIVRIEDTDIARNVEGGIESQLENLDWLKITIDESVRNPKNYGPYVQTQKLDRYKELAHKLLTDGKAYMCFCSKDELSSNRNNSMNTNSTPKYNRRCLNLTKEEIQSFIDQKKPYVIRLKVEDNTNIEWDDLIRGKISFPTLALTDPVILKSNNIPMYNFAVVVDDYDMDISHVIRGEEHISNTPYQIAIKNALGFNSKEIKYGHLSVIIDETGKKLSKRNKELKQFIDDYKKVGFIPQAVTNFLAFLGWTPNDSKEIMSMDEIISKFDINHVSKSPTFFDYKKMLWTSNQYFKAMDDEQYLQFVDPFINIDFKQFKAFKKDLLLLFKNQLSFASELNILINETFFEYNVDLENILFTESWVMVIKTFMNEINKVSEIKTYDDAKEIINKVKKATNVNGKDLFMPIRLFLTAKEHGPELFKIIYIFQKEGILLKEKMNIFNIKF